MQFHLTCDIAWLTSKTRKFLTLIFYFIFMMISDFFCFSFSTSRSVITRKTLNDLQSTNDCARLKCFRSVATSCDALSRNIQRQDQNNQQRLWSTCNGSTSIEVKKNSLSYANLHKLSLRLNSSHFHISEQQTFRVLLEWMQNRHKDPLLTHFT